MNETKTYTPPHVADVQRIEDREAKELLAKGLEYVIAFETGILATCNGFLKINAGLTEYLRRKLESEIKIDKCNAMLRVLKPETETGETNRDQDDA